MPATITLKNIPDELHLRLKQSAALNRRSLHSELLVRLEAPAHVGVRPLVDETIARLSKQLLRVFPDIATPLPA